ncbi:ABC transporter ATP-binding protein [Coralliovum pocilloporae]|uniref:ABC transporter ATP-binding protein n=1 Tax=Coralliovum pocilloporae TaxID=3066369 RepID=UPI0033078C5F
MTQSASAQAPREFAPWKNPDEKPLIRFQNVIKRFGSFTAIDDLTLNIYEREFYALLGPSGCGKTTMMRLLAGFETVTEGQILLDGEDLSNIPANRRPINMMFQSYALFPHLTVEKNIAFGLKQDRWPKAEIKERVDEMLALVQLEKFASRKPHQLSGGQRQRVALARSLAKKPKVLLLDEPLGALDKKLREQTQFELMNIQEQLGLTFIIVTHDQEEAMTVASRIAVMDQGEVLQVATPADIYEYPNSRYVADFIGDVNLIEAHIADTSGEFIEADWSGNTDRMRIRPHPGETHETGATVWLALRPEKVGISKEKPEAAPNINMVEGEVWEISYTGNISTYHVKLDDGTMVKAQEANRLHLARREITWEDRVWLHWRAGSGVLLNR